MRPTIPAADPGDLSEELLASFGLGRPAPEPPHEKRSSLASLRTDPLTVTCVAGAVQVAKL